jgi:hypothetical protein
MVSTGHHLRTPAGDLAQAGGNVVEPIDPAGSERGPAMTKSLYMMNSRRAPSWASMNRAAASGSLRSTRSMPPCFAV